MEWRASGRNRIVGATRAAREPHQVRWHDEVEAFIRSVEVVRGHNVEREQHVVDLDAVPRCLEIEAPEESLRRKLQSGGPVRR